MPCVKCITIRCESSPRRHYCEEHQGIQKEDLMSNVMASDSSNSRTQNTVNDKEDLYSFMKPAPPSPGNCNVEGEVKAYLSNSSTASIAQ